MRLALRSAFAAASVLALSGSFAAAAPAPGGKATGKFDYSVVYPTDVTQCVPDFGCPSAGLDTGNLVVNLDEGSQKRFVSVDYRLDATGAATWALGTSGQFIGKLYPATITVTGLLPDDNGHVVGSLALEVAAPRPPRGWRCLTSSRNVSQMSPERSFRDLPGIHTCPV